MSSAELTLVSEETSFINKPEVKTTLLSEMALWKRFLARGDSTCGERGEEEKLYTHKRVSLSFL